MPPPKVPLTTALNSHTNEYPAMASTSAGFSSTAATGSNHSHSHSSHSNRPPISATSVGGKKRTHTGLLKKKMKKTGNTVAGEKRAQVSSCDTCKDGHRKCNGLEPCMSCQDSATNCTYDLLSPTKRKLHDAYVLMKKREEAQFLKNAEIIVARMPQMTIAGSENNFGPILSQVINLPRYEAPPMDFKDQKQHIKTIGRPEMLLIDCYFSYFNYYIPILSRKTFMEQVNDPKQLETMTVQKLLACVLATGFGFRREIGERDLIDKMEPNYGMVMCRKFRQFNLGDMFASSIENCQCYLILTGFYSSIANYDAVHNLVALAHSGAANQGLNRDKGVYYQDPTREHTQETIEMGHRVYFSVVIVCSGYSLGHQSPFITSNDYDISPPRRLPSDKCLDFQGKTHDDFDGIQHLVHFLPMYEITSRVADITCTATKRRPHVRVDEVRGMLEEWRTKTLPQELRITPTDVAAIERQSRFSKLYHAVSYMFEICLHHTFQLHESHREMGIHGIWSNYCFDAAVGILNIYRTRPMTRMNAHVVLPVAAGAFANVVASKLSFKEEIAQRHCDEIKNMLAEIVKASSSMERDELLKYAPHGYMSVTQFVVGKVDPFVIPGPGSPPMNERSPAETASSSPSQTTYTTGDTDLESSEYEDEGVASGQEDSSSDYNKRMSGQFEYANGHQMPLAQQDPSGGFRQQQQQQQAQPQHPHPCVASRMPSNSSNPSLFPPSESQHPQNIMTETNYTANGYSGMMPVSMQSPVSAGPYTGTVASPGLPPYGDSSNAGEFAHSDRRHLQHRTSSDPSLISDFSDDAKLTVDKDTYYDQRNYSNTRHHQQQPQSFSAGAGQYMDGGDDSCSSSDLSRPQHQNSMSSNSTTSSDGMFAGNEMLGDFHGVGLDGFGQELWHLNNTRRSNAQLTIASPSSQTHFTEGYNHHGQYVIQQPQQQRSQHHQQQQQQHPNYSSFDISISGSLDSSHLLSGGFDGAGSMVGLGSIPGLDFASSGLVQDSYSLFPTTMVPSLTSISSKSISGPSDLASPVTPTSANEQQQHQQQQQSMGMSNHGNNNLTLGNLMGYHNQHQESLNMSSFSSGLSPDDQNVYAAALQQEGASGIGLGSAGGNVGPEGVFVASEFENAILNGGSGGTMNIMNCMNDPKLEMQQRLFSSVARNNIPISAPQYQQQQRPHPYR